MEARRHSVYRRASVNLGTPPPTRSRSAERSGSSSSMLHIEVESPSDHHAGVVESPSFDSKGAGGSFEAPESVRSLRPRAMSDPLDTADAEGVAKEEVHDFGDPIDDEVAIPTLPRFPYIETNNKNCWSESPISTFTVRGKDYLSDKKKIPAEKYLLRARGCDLFLSDNASAVEMSRFVNNETVFIFIFCEENTPSPKLKKNSFFPPLSFQK